MANNKNFFYLSLIGFFGIFSTTISKNPVLPLFVHAMNGSDSLLGAISAISPFAGICLSFPVGYYSDILGRRKLLLIAASFFLIIPLLYLIVNSPGWLIPIRFLHGFATAILNPVGLAIIMAGYPESKGEKLGTYSSITLVGRTIAPALGGFIIGALAGMGGMWNYKFVYIAAFICALPVIAGALLYKDPPAQVEMQKPTIGGLLASFKEVFADLRLLSTGTAELATYFAFGVTETFVPIYATALGISAAKIGIIFSLQILSIAITKPFFGKLADRIDKRMQILIGLVCLGLSIGIMPYFSNYYAITAVSVLFGVGMSFCTVATTTYAAETAKAENLGAAVGALSSIMDIGHSGGPLVAGIIITAISLKAGFIACAALCSAAFVFFLVANSKNS
jgi:MFS family permease